MKVLMPDETYCCQNGFRIDTRPSTIRIFDVQKVFPALYYHGRCRHCKKNTTILFRKIRVSNAFLRLEVNNNTLSLRLGSVLL